MPDDNATRLSLQGDNVFSSSRPSDDHVRLQPFDPSVCPFAIYESRFRQIVAYKEIPAAKQTQFLLTAITDAQFYLLTNLVAPDEPASKTMDELLTAMRNHFDPKPLVRAERLKFRRHVQREGESIATYTAELKRMATSCDFGSNLDDQLCDQFIAGLKSERIQDRLCSEADLTFAKATQLALQMETIQNQLPVFRATSQSSTVQAVQSKFPKKGRQSHERRESSSTSTSSQSSSRGETSSKSKSGRRKGKCTRCGAPDHAAPKCPCVSYTCYKCQKVGHLARACRSRPTRVSDVRNVHEVEDHPEYYLSFIYVENEPEVRQLFPPNSDHVKDVKGNVKPSMTTSPRPTKPHPVPLLEGLCVQVKPRVSRHVRSTTSPNSSAHARDVIHHEPASVRKSDPVPRVRASKSSEPTRVSVSKNSEPTRVSATVPVPRDDDSPPSSSIDFVPRSAVRN